MKRMPKLSSSEVLLQIIGQRRSVRRFSPQPVEREKLLMCLEAARYAPSAENVQPWRFLVVDDVVMKERLVEGAFSGIYRATRWAAQAPVLVVMFAELDWLANRLGKQITGIHYYLLDIGIAGEHFVLQAQALGLGTCWIGWFSASGVRKAMATPRKWRPVAMLAVGYPAGSPSKNRKLLPLEQIACFNHVPKG